VPPLLLKPIEAHLLVETQKQTLEAQQKELKDWHKILQIRVVQKLQFLNNFCLKTAKCGAFCKTCSITNRVIEQVHYPRTFCFPMIFPSADR
jgi:hypothetical protein